MTSNNCSECQNIDCDCFKDFVKSVSKRDISNRSGRGNILNNLYALVETSQYNIFTAKFLSSISSAKNLTFFINKSDDITIIDLKKKIDELKNGLNNNLMSMQNTSQIVNNSNLSLVDNNNSNPSLVDNNNSNTSLVDNNNSYVTNFLERIYDQLEKTTFLYGHPNRDILYYEEHFYSVYKQDIYNTKYTNFACGVFNKENNIYICSSGFQNNIFNIYYALYSIPNIEIVTRTETPNTETLNTQTPNTETSDIEKSLIIVLNIFIYSKLKDLKSLFIFPIDIIEIIIDKNSHDLTINNIINYFGNYKTFYDKFKLLLEPVKDNEITDNEQQTSPRKIDRTITIEENTTLHITLYGSNDKVIVDKINGHLKKFNEVNEPIKNLITNFIENRNISNYLSLEYNDPLLYIDACLKKSLKIKEDDPKKFKEKLIKEIKLPDVFTLYDKTNEKYLNFIENEKYRNNYYGNKDKSERNKIVGQYIPFKRLNTKTDEILCYNGSLCCEPKLFNWLIDNNIIKTIEKGEKNNNFSCFWHGTKSSDDSNNDSLIMSVNQNGCIDKKLFVFGYYSYLLDKYNNDVIGSIRKPGNFNPVFNHIMLPCSGCQINYKDILNNKIENAETYNWNASNCGTEMPSLENISNTPRPTCVNRVACDTKIVNNKYDEDNHPTENINFTGYDEGYDEDNFKGGKPRYRFKFGIKKQTKQNIKTKRTKKFKKTKTQKTSGKRKNKSRRLKKY